MHLSLRHISKRFGATLANDDVSLDIPPGRVLALLGENGAGKSTLMKILYGMIRPDTGDVVIDGRPVRLPSPRAAMDLGIGMVFQRFSLIPALTVRENLALANPRTPWIVGSGARRVPGLLDRLRDIAPDVDPDARVSTLPVGQIQQVELAKVLNLETRLLILDEPSAVLSDTEAERLWSLVREIAVRGIGVVLITHKLADVRACADDVAVMRRGKVVGLAAAADTDAPALLRMLVGDDTVATVSAEPVRRNALPRIWIRDVSADGPSGTIRDIDLRIAPGEVLGIAGVAGNGQDTLADACAGVTALRQGEVIVDAETLFAPRLEPRNDGRVAYLPEQPIRNAVGPDLSLAVNLSLRCLRSLPWMVDRKHMAKTAADLMERFDVRPPEPGRRAETLSGGNLQKLVAARELSGSPALVVACYPTMGLDVTASAAMYARLFAMAREGCAVLWISEDLDDLLRYAHRIAVLFRGRIAGVCDAGPASRTRIGAWMTGAEAFA